jgi:phosphate:Na+ symporter
MLSQLSLILAGLAFFFSGLAGVRAGFRNLATPGMRRITQRITSHPLLAAFWGLASGAITQSATGVGFVLTGLVAAGAISISVALLVLVFANLGTTVLVFVAAVDTRDLAYLLIGIGGLLGGIAFFNGLRPFLQLVGSVGSILLGLLLMREVGATLPGQGWFDAIAVVVAGSAVGAFLFGLGLRLLVQSSSAVVLVAMAFVGPGSFSEPQVLLLIHGATIGIGLSTWALGRGLKGIPRRIVLFQSIINVTGGGALAILWVVDQVFGVSLVTSFVLESSWLSQAYRLPTGFLIQQLVVTAIGLVLIPVAPRSLAFMSPATAAEALANPEYLDPAFEGDPVTGCALVRSEQQRFIRHLPALLDDIAADAAADQRPAADTAEGIAQLAVEIRMFLKQMLAKGLDTGSAAEVLELRHRQMELEELVDATGRFATAVKAFRHHRDGTQTISITSSMTEGLHLLLSMLGRAAGGDEADASVLRVLTADAGGIVGRIRAEIAGGDPSADGTHLLEAGTYFERAVWIVGRLLPDRLDDDVCEAPEDAVGTPERRPRN